MLPSDSGGRIEPPAAQQRDLAQYDDCKCPRSVVTNGCAGIVSYDSSISCLVRMVPVSRLLCRMRTTVISS